MDDARRLRFREGNEIAMTLDALAREGAPHDRGRAGTEVGEYDERFADERDEDGKRLVVRTRAPVSAR